jgi:hypothetical protein
VPWAGYNGSIQVAFPRGSPAVRAYIVNGVKSALYIEEGNTLPLDVDRRP